MNCEFRFVAEDGPTHRPYRHHCADCGEDKLSKQSDPSRIVRRCAAFAGEMVNAAFVLVGAELTNILLERGLHIGCAACDRLAAELNAITPEAIAADRDRWIKAIRRNFHKLGVLKQFWLGIKSSPAAKWSVASKGINGAIGEMLDEAIRRAREKQATAGVVREIDH
jgi:hypothetical protein